MARYEEADWAPQQIGDQRAPGEHRTLAEKAFSSLHEAILTGALKPGERLPIEEVAELLGMSPMPVREAVRRLDLLGLVQNIPHKGARVTELSMEDLSEIYALRLILEPLAVYRAAEVFDQADLQRAQTALDVMNAAPDGSPDTWRSHSAFHLCLYGAAGSSWLMRLIQPLWESSERYRLAIVVKPKVAHRRNEHERLLKACVDHEPARAAYELYNHLAITANAQAKAMGGDHLFAILEGGSWRPAPAEVS
ncbi:MAG: GntR family transcriptional regulator [Acidimicrobiales bacterium]